MPKRAANQGIKHQHKTRPCESEKNQERGVHSLILISFFWQVYYKKIPILELWDIQEAATGYFFFP